MYWLKRKWRFVVALLVMTMGALLLGGAAQPRNAWQATYWNNRNMEGAPVLVREESNINYNWRDQSPAPGVNNDHFSVRWERVINVSAGSYRFTATMDDGMRVYVDGQRIIDSWTASQEHSLSADVWLGAGDHTVKVEYYEYGGQAVARLSWTSSPGSYNNWRGEYFNNVSLSGNPVLVRDDAQINFNWGGGSPEWGVVGADQFSVRWTNTLNLGAGRYRFTTRADDGVRLWVNNQLIIDKWFDQQATSYSAEVNHFGGGMSVRMEYYEQVGGAEVHLSWISVGSVGSGGPWRAEFYNNTWLGGSPVLTRDDGQINFNWGTGAPAAGVGADRFSARWVATVPLNSGRYRFNARADDGVRLWVNNQLIIDQWRDGAATTYSGEIDLSGGNIPVKLEYYENVGAAELSLTWQQIGSGPGPISNWRGEYYNNTALSGGPALVRDDAQINFNWGSGSPAPGVIGNDRFSVRWTRDIPVNSGRYRFTVSSDDGVRLWVNNQLLVDQWHDQAASTYTVETNLPGGNVPVRLDYYENTLAASVALSWTPVSGTTPPPTGATAVVTAPYYANVRQGPAVSFSVITTVNRGATVSLLGRNGASTWLQIRLANGTTGWTYYTLLNPSVPISSLPVTDGGTTPPPPSGSPTGTVTAYHLNVRSGPGVGYTIVSVLDGGDRVTLLGRNAASTWLKLRTSGGITGWSSARYIQSSVPVSSLPVQ